MKSIITLHLFHFDRISIRKLINKYVEFYLQFFYKLFTHLLPIHLFPRIGPNIFFCFILFLQDMYLFSSRCLIINVKNTHFMEFVAALQHDWIKCNVLINRKYNNVLLLKYKNFCVVFKKFCLWLHFILILIRKCE